MENYSHPEIPELLKLDGNNTCVDCGAEKPNWASLNNGVFLCLKCAGIHRSFGMSVSLIRSLQIDSWTEKQLLYLKKGGNINFKNNLSEFNIAETATLDIKYKSKAADYYRKFLKNEVEKESDPNYAPIQIEKPDNEVAMDLLEVKESGEEEKADQKQEEKGKVFKNKFFGFMSNMFNKVKTGTTEAAKKVEKGFADLKIKDKFKAAGNAIAEATKNSINKTKEGMNNLAQKTKAALKKGGNQQNPETNQTNPTEEKKEEEKKEEEKKEEEKKEEVKEEKKEEVKEEKKEENKGETKEEEKKEENDKKDDAPKENGETTEEKKEENTSSA